jgi:hypothetical protein
VGKPIGLSASVGAVLMSNGRYSSFASRFSRPSFVSWLSRPDRDAALRFLCGGIHQKFIGASVVNALLRMGAARAETAGQRHPAQKVCGL